MTLFDSFSKPGWQSRKLEVRMAAIDQLDDTAILLELVRTDPEPGVRACALARISSAEALEELCESLSPPLKDQARKQRLNQLLPDPGQLAAIADDAILVQIAGFSDDPSLVEAAIAQVKSQQTRLEVAGSHPVAKIRFFAAQGVEDIDQLKALMQQTKNKDKSVFRYCKERVDQYHAEEKAAAERSQQIHKLVEAAANLAAAPETSELRARVILLSDQWQPLETHADPVQKRRVEADLAVCKKRLAELAKDREAEQAHEAQVQEAQQNFAALLAELERIVPTPEMLADAALLGEFSKSLDGVEERWVSAILVTQPSDEQTRACKNHLNQWREVTQSAQRVLDRRGGLKKLHDEAGRADKLDFLALQKVLGKVNKQLSNLSWPEHLSALTPDSINELRALQKDLQAQLDALKTQEEQNLETVDKAFIKLREELEDNHFKNADRWHNKLRNLLRHLSPARQDHYYQELRPLTARLGEIHDWQGFAIEPKKIELCERMAALVDNGDDPNVLATRIKALQSEWKALGPLSPRRDQALWKKFHSAAEEAYAPCKAAFEQQAELRKQNLHQRMELVSQLIDYDKRMAWPGQLEFENESTAPDWKLVQKKLDTARAAFNGIGPVSAKGERRSRKALQTICDKIYGHIKDEYGRNIERKEALVAQAKACVEMEDLKEAINQAKALQRDWKQVGLTPRQIDRRLWKDFRSACDDIFGRLDDARKEQDVARNERAAAAREKAEQAKARKLKELQRWPNLLEKMQACAMKVDDEKTAVELWEKEEDIPREIDNAALLTWWENGSDDSVSEDQLRETCIALEVLLEMDSPPEDKKARMAYQMQRLVEGIGSQQGDQEALLLEQVNGVIALRPQAAWLERFCKSLAAAKSRAG